MGSDAVIDLGFSLTVKRDDYTGTVKSCALECRGAAMLMEDGSYQFFGFAPPCHSLKELEAQLDGLLNQLNAVRKEARAVFRD
jgi:hypothetical protein